MTATLYAIHYSPWSIRARWALDHHGVRYDYREHLPMLGEPILRAKLGRWRAKITLPMLADGDTRLFDSMDIARWADERGEAPPIFDDEGEVAALSDRLITLAEDGRVRCAARTAQDREALIEAVPLPMPRPLALATGRYGVRFLEKKYGFDAAKHAARRDSMRATLELARERLDGRDHLHRDRLTFADMTLAAGMQFVAPLPPPTVRLGSRYRACWADPEVAEGFEDLVAWRDALVARHPFVPR